MFGEKTHSEGKRDVSRIHGWPCNDSHPSLRLQNTADAIINSR